MVTEKLFSDSIQTGRYRHFKGREYYVIGVATHSETEESFVVYQSLYGRQRLWVRPYPLFFGTVSVNGQLTPRFVYCGD